LPKRGFKENMYAQYSVHLPGIEIDVDKKRITVDLHRYEPFNFYEQLINENLDFFSFPLDSFAGFFEMIKREFPSSKTIVKGQTTGPISTGLQIFNEENKPIVYDESYCEIVRKNLNMMTRWQVKTLLKKCQKTIIFIDEPSLSLLGTPYASIKWEDAIAWINDVLEGVEGWKGIHCCGNTDWSKVIEADIDILSFDAYDYGYTISLYPEEISRFLERGGALAWGIVPNNEEVAREENIDSLVEKVISEIETMKAKGVDEELLIRNSLVTPQCGLGGMSEEGSESAIRTLVSVSRELRKKLGLEEVS
jgi:methionine synthase II (cobalamin-independent)